MRERKNATCAICGKGYEMCYSCRKNDPSSLWKIHCDTPEHYKIFQVVNGYTAGVYDIDEAAKKFENINLSDLEELRPNIKKIIKEILDSKKKDDVVDIDDSNKEDSDDEEAVVEEEPKETSSKRTRRRKQ